MSSQFDWQFDEGNGDGPPQRPPGRIRGALRFWLALGLGLALFAVVYGGGRLRQAAQAEASRAAVQAVVDEMAAACAAGDGDRYFATQSADAAWQATQLHPRQTTIFCGDVTVSRTRQDDEHLEANLIWEDAAGRWQRAAFFGQTVDGLVMAPPPVDAFGPTVSMSFPWGTLLLPESEADLAPTLDRFVQQVVDEATCFDGRCGTAALPFTLHVRPDYAQTVAPYELFVPLPRLVALDDSGQPGAPFWELLEQTLIAHLTPGTIRFAVPSILQQVIDFERAAGVFMRLNPDVTVEIVPVALHPEEPDATLLAYDGAAYTPDLALLASGGVLDLTDFANSDPRLDQADFYEQVWRGSLWRDRQWIFPQAGQLRLLFFDCCVYDTAKLPEPSLRWTWSEMERDAAELLARGRVDPATAWQGSYGLADPTYDLLFAYAYNQQAACSGLVPATCGEDLRRSDVAAALAWYRAMTAEQALMPPVAGLPPDERTAFMVNRQAFRRDAAIWVDEPVNYEHQIQNFRVEVRPFPGSDRFDGVTPVWVHGSFISATSERPRDVWRWLRFLSYRPLNGPLRYVPARPSVAAQMQYWDRLPGPLRDGLRAAFPFGRPVTFADERRFSREQLEAVAAGRLSPDEAAGQSGAIRWFGR